MIEVQTLSPVQEFYANLEDLQEEFDNSFTRKRGRKANKEKQYFTIITEAAICAYNEETSERLRNKIYQEYIYKPFCKLAENLIHTFKFYHFDVPRADVKHAVVAFLHEKIHNYNQSKGKAFSYFSIVAKNYLIVENRKNYNHQSGKGELDEIDLERDLNREESERDYIETLRNFIDEFIEWYRPRLTQFYETEEQIEVAESVLELMAMSRRDELEFFNKKALYILIKERTSSTTHVITPVITCIKEDFQYLWEHYAKHGKID